MDPPKPEPPPGLPRQVVYVPSCVTRMMGPARSDSETASVHEKLLSLFAKAGYEVIYPEARPHALHCCCRPTDFVRHLACSQLLIPSSDPDFLLHSRCVMLASMRKLRCLPFASQRATAL